jgi:putative ABC transport system permease protein
VFDFPLVAGDLNTALEDPFSMVITEKMAHRYFGSEDPLGKVISLEITILPGDGFVARKSN